MNYWVKFANEAAESALDTLLWSEMDDDGTPFDNLEHELHESVQLAVLGMVCSFLDEQAVRDDITALDLSAQQVGHNLILSANGHGTGFWDHEWGHAGQRLNVAAKAFPSSLYEGDDGETYFA